MQSIRRLVFMKNPLFCPLCAARNNNTRATPRGRSNAYCLPIVSGGVARFDCTILKERAQRDTFSGADGPTFAGMINARLHVPSPLAVTVTSEDNGARARVVVEVVEPINPTTDLVLRLAVTEDGVELAGTNGVEVPTTLGSHEFVIETPLDAGWVAENLHLAGWMRDDATKQVFNAARCPVEGGTVGTPAASLPAALVGAFPNPFNPITDVVFRLPEAGPVEVAVIDLSGRRLAMLIRGDYPVGVHQVTWDGRDSRGRSQASGTYLIRLKSEDGVHRKKVSLVR